MEMLGPEQTLFRTAIVDAATVGGALDPFMAL